MLTKTILVAVAALALCQGIAGQESLQDILADALNKTRSQAAQAATQSAAQQLQNIVHSIITSGGNVFNSSAGILQGLASEVNDAVETAVGDLPQCIAGQQSEAARLLASAQDGVWGCVLEEVDAVGQLIADVASLAGRAVLLPNQAGANITACVRYPLTVAFCVAEAVGAWGQASEQIAVEVAADVQRGQQLLVSGPRDIATCAASKVNTAAAGAHQIIVSIAQCVVDGSKSSSSTASPSS